MSRSSYSDDYVSDWAMIRWRGAVSSAIRGKRGQAFLREMLTAFDALPNKRLIRDELEADGDFCALGAVGRARGLDMAQLDPYDPEIPAVFGIPRALACEIMYENDVDYKSPEVRFHWVRNWVESQIR